MTNKIPVRQQRNYNFTHDDDRMSMSDENKRNAALLTLAGLAATGVAIYLLSGERGRHNRAQIKHWMDEAKEEVTNRASKLKNVDPQAVRSIVDAVFGKDDKQNTGGNTSNQGYRRSLRNDEIE